MNFHLKRAYDPPAPEDGTRILVDRLWPRGLKRDHARIDLWLKDIAPSTDLRSWFGHRPERWEEFARRYHAELKANPDPLKQIREAASSGPCTLLYAAHDTERNNAVVLKAFLESHH
jgi:uncharacterized protein YeaO (DUF488 family)